MSIKSALESEGIDLSNFMNLPQSMVKNVNGQNWTCCPFCQKKALLILPDTKIKKLVLKCKGCKENYEVNV